MHVSVLTLEPNDVTTPVLGKSLADAPKAFRRIPQLGVTNKRQTNIMRMRGYGNYKLALEKAKEILKNELKENCLVMLVFMGSKAPESTVLERGMMSLKDEIFSKPVKDILKACKDVRSMCSEVKGAVFCPLFISRRKVSDKSTNTFANMCKVLNDGGSTLWKGTGQLHDLFFVRRPCGYYDTRWSELKLVESKSAEQAKLRSIVEDFAKMSLGKERSVKEATETSNTTMVNEVRLLKCRFGSMGRAYESQMKAFSEGIKSLIESSDDPATVLLVKRKVAEAFEQARDEKEKELELLHSSRANIVAEREDIMQKLSTLRESVADAKAESEKADKSFAALYLTPGEHDGTHTSSQTGKYWKADCLMWAERVLDNFDKLAYVMMRLLNSAKAIAEPIEKLLRPDSLSLPEQWKKEESNEETNNETIRFDWKAVPDEGTMYREAGRDAYRREATIMGQLIYEVARKYNLKLRPDNSNENMIKIITAAGVIATEDGPDIAPNAVMVEKLICWFPIRRLLTDVDPRSLKLQCMLVSKMMGARNRAKEKIFQKNLVGIGEEIQLLNEGDSPESDDQKKLLTTLRTEKFKAGSRKLMDEARQEIINTKEYAELHDMIERVYAEIRGVYKAASYEQGGRQFLDYYVGAVTFFANGLNKLNDQLNGVSKIRN